ncbi:MAG: hypothetical protein ABIQ44_13525 [Chloroflexia bacterium]
MSPKTSTPSTPRSRPTITNARQLFLELLAQNTTYGIGSGLIIGVIYTIAFFVITVIFVLSEWGNGGGTSIILSGACLYFSAAIPLALFVSGVIGAFLGAANGLVTGFLIIKSYYPLTNPKQYARASQILAILTTSILTILIGTAWSIYVNNDNVFATIAWLIALPTLLTTSATIYTNKRTTQWYINYSQLNPTINQELEIRNQN